MTSMPPPAPTVPGPTGLQALLRGGALTLGGSVGQGILKLMAATVVARTGGPETQGALGIAVACISFGAIVTSLGLDYANGYMVGRQRARPGSIAANTLLVAAVGLPVALAWTAGYEWLFPQMVSPSGAAGSLLVTLTIAAALVATMVSQSLQSIIVGLQRYGVFAAGNLIGGITWLVGVWIVGAGSYLLLIACWLLSTVASAAVYWSAIRSMGDKPFRLDGTLLRSSLSFGLRTLPGSCFRSLNFRLGLYLVALYLSKADVGIYTFALAIAESLLYLPSALSFVVFGGTLNRTVEAVDVRRVSIVMGLVGGLASLAALLVGRPLLVALAGAPYAAGAIPLALLMVASTLHAIGALRLHRLVALGRPSAATAAQGATSVIMAIAGIVLITRFGLVGAASAAALAYLAYATVLFLIHDNPLSAEEQVRIAPAASGRGGP